MVAGRHIAYESDESGRFEIYVRPLTGSTAKRQLSRDGGHSPTWSRDGREIVYATDAHLMAVTIETTPELRSGAPRELFATERFVTNPYGNWLGFAFDISPSGESFLMIERPAPTSSEIEIVLNWTEELKRLVPAEN